MLLGTKKTLYDHVIEALLGKSATVADIQEYLKNKGVSATIQGIYKALRELIAEDIVVKQKKIYLISSVWRNKLAEVVSQRPPFKLSAGERTTYRFNKLDHLDMFWKHIIEDIQHEMIGYPVFHGTPHNFWYLVPGRKESEEEYYEGFSKTKTHVFSVIGGTTPFDKNLKQQHPHEYQQFHFEENYPFSRRDHISVIGPYIITTRISIPLTNESDRLYTTCQSENELQQKLEPLFKKSGVVILVVEHNMAKAKKMRKQMAKEFYIAPELRTQFDLF